MSMFGKYLVGAALASQALLGVAQAETVRPRAVSFASAAPVQSLAAPARATRAMKGDNGLVGVPLLVPILVGVAVLATVVVVVASDDDSSPD